MALVPDDSVDYLSFPFDLPTEGYMPSQYVPAPSHGDQEPTEPEDFPHSPLIQFEPLPNLAPSYAPCNAQGPEGMTNVNVSQSEPSHKRQMPDEPGPSGSFHPYAFTFTFPVHPANCAPSSLPAPGLELPGLSFANHAAGTGTSLPPGWDHSEAPTQMASSLGICSSSDDPESLTSRKATNEEEHALSTLPATHTTETSQHELIDPWLSLVAAWSGQNVGVAPASGPSSSRDESPSEPYVKTFKYKASNPEADLTCEYCPAKFTDPSTCRRHVKQHKKDMSKRCRACGKKCSRLDCLLRHARLAGEASPCYWSARNDLGWDPEKGEQQQKKRKKK